jgi:hypothetical protein
VTGFETPLITEAWLDNFVSIWSKVGFEIPLITELSIRMQLAEIKSPTLDQIETKLSSQASVIKGV